MLTYLHSIGIYTALHTLPRHHSHTCMLSHATALIVHAFPPPLSHVHALYTPARIILQRALLLLTADGALHCVY
jgi:hypothetical protein